MGKFTYDANLGLIAHTDGARTVWASDSPPALLLPAANTITLTAKTIAFPDFVKNNVMFMGAWNDSTYFPNPYGILYTSGISFATILPGEYGPGGAGPYYLAQELVGIVPVGVNYLNIKTTLNWTTHPDNILTFPVASGIPVGQETYLAGSCALLEQISIFRRIIKFVLSGTSIYLQRFQSVVPRAYAHDSANLKADPQTWTSGPNGAWMDMWTHGGDYSGHLAFELGRSVTGANDKQRGGSNAPPTADISDFSSLWTGDFVIRPGVIRF